MNELVQRKKSRKFWIPNTLDRRRCPFAILLQDVEGFRSSFPFLSLFFFLFFFFFSLFYVFWKWWPRVEGIKRRMSPLFQVLPPWKAAKSGSISFKIRTNEPNGLIMYSRSGAHTRVRWFSSFFSLFWRMIIVNTGIIRNNQSIMIFPKLSNFPKFTMIYFYYFIILDLWYVATFLLFLVNTSIS